MQEKMICVVVNGKEQNWPLQEYLDYKAWTYGFESYKDLKAAGFEILY